MCRFVYMQEEEEMDTQGYVCVCLCVLGGGYKEVCSVCVCYWPSAIHVLDE